VGTVGLDFVQNKIVVGIYNDICGSMTAQPGTIHCMAAVQQVATITVPMQKRALDGCHSEHYSGINDATMVDGSRNEIEVIDHKSRVCDDVHMTLVEVKATVYSPMTNQTRTYLLSK